MSTVLPTDALGLPAGAPQYIHHFEPYDGAGHLVICIAGLHTDMTKPRIAWPYRPRLANLAAHRVFIDPVPPVPGEPWIETPLLAEFVDVTRRHLGVPAERTILCGSSLGASAGILAAVRAHIGRVMAGSPVARIGDYVLDPDVHETVRLGLRRGTPAPERLEHLNALVPNALRAHEAPLQFDLFFGEADHLFPGDYETIVEACRANPAIGLRTLTHPGIHHGNVYRPWARHMTAILKSITGTAPE